VPSGEGMSGEGITAKTQSLGCKIGRVDKKM
jgi:hypothetical protein